MQQKESTERKYEQDEGRKTFSNLEKPLRILTKTLDSFENIILMLQNGFNFVCKKT